MNTGLETRDKVLVASSIALALFFGLIGEYMNWQIEIGITDFWQALVPAVVSLYFIHKTSQRWGGKFRKFLTLIGAGLALHGALWGLVVQWHIMGAPSVLGINSSAVYVLLHGMSAVAFLLTAQGFYLFYNYSKQETE